MSDKSTSVVPPESEAPPASEAPAPSAPAPSTPAPVSTEAPPPAAKPPTVHPSGVPVLHWKGDKTKFRHLNVDTDKHEYDVPAVLPSRPGFNTTGQAVQVNLNSFPIIQYPDKTIYQYDVSVPRP
jgi:hypothetical protein